MAALPIMAAMPATHERSFWTISGDPNNGYAPDPLSSAGLNPAGVTNVGAFGMGRWDSMDG